MTEPTSSDANDETTAAPTLKYEAARDELIDVVKQLEGGGLTLEQSIALWERGEELANICQAWLDGAKARLESATDSDDE
jgi:exodeoxyribonuclease VII small subunit